jgi:hypothetical protein
MLGWIAADINNYFYHQHLLFVNEWEGESYCVSKVTYLTEIVLFNFERCSLDYRHLMQFNGVEIINY